VRNSDVPALIKLWFRQHTHLSKNEIHPTQGISDTTDDETQPRKRTLWSQHAVPEQQSLIEDVDARSPIQQENEQVFKFTEPKEIPGIGAHPLPQRGETKMLYAAVCKRMT
jgi:hypothetical protein